MYKRLPKEILENLIYVKNGNIKCFVHKPSPDGDDDGIDDDGIDDDAFFKLLLMLGVIDKFLSTIEEVQIAISSKTDFIQRVCFDIVDEETGKLFESTCPVTKIYDMTVFYIVPVFNTSEGFAALKVTNDLHAYAKINTPKFFPPVVSDLLSSSITVAMKNYEKAWSVTTSSGMNGGISILYDEVLTRLKTEGGCGLVIYPVSINEIYVCAYNVRSDMKAAAEAFYEMLSKQTERISNNIYDYDGCLNAINITD